MALSDEQHQAGLDRARQYAAYEIGDADWADLIIRKYLEGAQDAMRVQLRALEGKR